MKTEVKKTNVEKIEDDESFIANEALRRRKELERKHSNSFYNNGYATSEIRSRTVRPKPQAAFEEKQEAKKWCVIL